MRGVDFSAARALTPYNAWSLSKNGAQRGWTSNDFGGGGGGGGGGIRRWTEREFGRVAGGRGRELVRRKFDLAKPMLAMAMAMEDEVGGVQQQGEGYVEEEMAVEDVVVEEDREEVGIVDNGEGVELKVVVDEEGDVREMDVLDGEMEGEETRSLFFQVYAHTNRKK